MKNRHKILSSIALLAIAVFAVTSTTFAWITMNNNAMVESIYLQVGSETDGLFIGVEKYVDKGIRVCSLRGDLQETPSIEDYAELTANEKTGYAPIYILDETKFEATITAEEYEVLFSQLIPAYDISKYAYNSTITADTYNALDVVNQVAYDNALYTLKDTISTTDYNSMTSEDLKALYVVDAEDTEVYNLTVEATVDATTYDALSEFEKTLYEVSEYTFDDTDEILSDTQSKALYEEMSESLKAYYKIDSYVLVLEDVANVSLYREYINENPTYADLYDQVAINALTIITYKNSLELDSLIDSIQFVDSGVTKEDSGKFSINPAHVTNDGGVLKTISDQDAANFNYENTFKATANKEYLNFQLFFRTSSVAPNQGIYLVGEGDSKSQVLAVGDVKSKYELKAWKALSSSMFGKDVAEGEKLDVRAANAVRVGFGSKYSTTLVWDPNKNVGFVNDGTYEVSPTQQKANLAEEWARGITNDSTINVGAKVEDNVITSAKDEISTGATQIVSLSTVGQFAQGNTWVSIWIEGTDSECFNALLEDEFSTKLSFAALTVAA